MPHSLLIKFFVRSCPWAMDVAFEVCSELIYHLQLSCYLAMELIVALVAVETVLSVNAKPSLCLGLKVFPQILAAQHK